MPSHASLDIVQKTGIIYETTVLLLIPAAQSVPLLFYKQGEKGFTGQKVFIFTGLCIFAANFIFHLMLLFLKNRKRALILIKIIRAIAWFLTIVNVVENQFADYDDTEEMSQEMALSYSVVGVFMLAIIQLFSMFEKNLKRAMVCASILYFSLRMSIKLQDPTLTAFAGLLCAIIIRFLVIIEKEKVEKPVKQTDKDFENFLLKTMLADTEEGFIILQNNKSIYYANPKSFDLLQSAPNELMTSLELIKRFDTLAREDQLVIKDRIVELHTEKDEGEGHSKTLNLPFSIADSQFKMLTRSPTSPKEYNFTREQTLENREHVPFFYPISTKEEKLLFPSWSKVSKITQKQTSFLFGNKSKSKGNMSGRSHTNFAQEPFSRTNTLHNIKSLNQETKTQTEFYFNNEKSQSEFLIPSLKNDNSRKYKVNQRLLSEGQVHVEEHIFPNGIPNNLSELFQEMKMENIPSVDLPFTLDQLSHTIARGASKNVIEHISYIQKPEHQIKMLDLKVQSLFLNKQPLLLIRLKELSEKEYFHFLKKSEKEKASMLSSVSHEMRTPLNCIITMLDIVEKSVSDELKEDFVRPASHSAKLLLSLVNDLLDFSQSKANTLKLNFSNFNLKQHLLDIIKLMDIQAKGKGLELNLDFDERVPARICSEPNRLRQIIINLIGNALKFTLRGSITISVSYLDHNLYRISVNDTGVGIKPENIKMLFRKFSKVSDTQNLNQQGVGLGLAISNMLAKLISPNNKGISVESRYGSGSTFSFEIDSKRTKDLPDDLEGALSSDDEEQRPVIENINALKEKIFDAELQQRKVLARRRTFTSAMKKMNSNNLSILQVNECEDVFYPRHRGSHDDHGQSLFAHEPRSAQLRSLRPRNVTINIKLESNLGLVRSSRTCRSIEEGLMPKDIKNSPKRRCLFEEQEFVKKMDEKDKVIQSITQKLNSDSEDPFLLVVDDNAFNIIALRKILEGLDFKIDSATNGDFAIQKVMERREKYDSNSSNYKIIFMDCNMPIKDGFETTKEIRAMEEQGLIPNITIIAVTASTHPSEIKKCFESGMDDYIPKPVNFNHMKEILTKYIKEDEN